MKNRLHPTIILEKLINSLVFILLIAYSVSLEFLENMAEADKMVKELMAFFNSNLLIFMLLFAVIILGIFVLIFAFIWKNTYLYFENNNLIISRGKLFKKVTTINLKDVATVNIRRNILEQILGTANLKIDLHTSNNETYHGKLVFKYDKALEIRDQILNNPKEEKTKDFKSDYEYKVGDVIKHLLLSIDLVSLIVILAVYSIVIMALAFKTNSLLGLILSIILVIILFMPLVWSLFKTYLSYYNFKCHREKDHIKLSYGAFTTYKFDLPINKISALIIRQSLQARIFKYYMLEVVNAGMGGQDHDEKTIISLYVKEKDKNKLLNSLVPEYKNRINLKSHEENSLKHYISAKLFWMICGIILSPFTYGLTLLLIPITLLIAYLQYKSKKIGFNKNLIIIENGILNKKRALIKYDNIELIAKKQKVFSKIFDTYLLRAEVVGPNNEAFVTGLFSQKVIDAAIKPYK